MIKDVLLVSALILSIVLIYRMYVVNQKINNLEEKVNVLDNFSQSIFNYITNNDEKEKDKEHVVTYSNQDIINSIPLFRDLNISENKIAPQSNQPVTDNIQMMNAESESDVKDYKTVQQNSIFQNAPSDDKLTENFESKESK